MIKIKDLRRTEGAEYESKYRLEDLVYINKYPELDKSMVFYTRELDVTKGIITSAVQEIFVENGVYPIPHEMFVIYEHTGKDKFVVKTRNSTYEFTMYLPKED